MKCWSCGKEIPETAKFCQHCEAPDQQDRDRSDRSAEAGEAFERLPPDAQKSLRELAKNCPTAEGFVDRAMVGNCPGCSSSLIGDLEHEPVVEDICVGRCFKCGFVWCLECGRELDKDDPHCTCFEEDEDQ